MKTKEEIVSKHYGDHLSKAKPYTDLTWVHNAMQEFAEDYHQDEVREELIKFASRYASYVTANSSGHDMKAIFEINKKQAEWEVDTYLKSKKQ